MSLDPVNPELPAPNVSPEARKAAEESLKFVHYWLNDWVNGLNSTERKYVVKFIQPFWAWGKHVLQVSGRLAIDHPVRLEVLKLMSQASKQATQEKNEEFLKPYLKGTIILDEKKTRNPKTGEIETEQTRLRTQSANPFGTILDMLNPSYGFSWMASPFAQAYTGRSMFTGKEATSPDVYEDFLTEQKAKFDKKTGEFVPVDKVPLEDLLFPTLMKSYFPQYSLADRIIAGGKTL